LLMSTTDWMPASAGMTNYDTVSEGGGRGGGDKRRQNKSVGFLCLTPFSIPPKTDNFHAETPAYLNPMIMWDILSVK
jgi:hypothetical protein